MKHQVLFSLKNKKKIYSRLSSAAVVIGALRVNKDYCFCFRVVVMKILPM